MSFDWKTEDFDWGDDARRQTRTTPAADELNAGLESIADEDESVPPAPRRRRPIAFAIVAAILSLAIVGLVYLQVERRASEGRARAEADVLASHEIVHNAALGGDTELFVGFLSGRDPQWAAAQAELVAGGAFDDRSGFGFATPLRDNLNGKATVTLAPDLNSAELSTAQNYEVVIGSGLTQTVTLSQTVIYRRGPDRWLLSPPEPDYWGESQAIDGRYARLIFPGRDRSVAQRLARDLEAVMTDLCATPAEGCPPLTVVLSTDPVSLAGEVVAGEQRRTELELNMPAPSIFGLPIDEASYRAVSRQYITRVVGAVVDDYTGWSCCTNLILYRALNDVLLNRLGLLTWVPSEEQFAATLDHPNPLTMIESVWGPDELPATKEESEAIATFISFLAQHDSTTPIIEAQRLLVELGDQSLWDWLAQVSDRRYPTPAAFEREWLRFSAEQLPAATLNAGLPAQDLQLICRSPGAVRSTLYRYDLQTGTLGREHEIANLDSPMLTGLADGEGVIVFGRNRRDNSEPPYLWRAGRVTTVQFEEDTDTGYVPLPSDSDRNPIIFLLDSDLSFSTFAILPLERCSEPSECRADATIGAPVMAPDGEQGLYVVGASNPLVGFLYQPLIYLGDGQGGSLNMLSHGWSPYWLDDDTFGYVLTSEGIDGQGIAIMDVGADEDSAVANQIAAATTPITTGQQSVPMGGATGQTTAIDPADIAPSGILLSTADLAAMGVVISGTSVHIDRVMPDPTGENLFIFTANPLQPDVPGLALVYNLISKTTTTMFEIHDEPYEYRRAYGLSPDGRWLVVSALRDSFDGNDETQWAVYVHAVESARAFDYTITAAGDWPADWLLDWSNDGRWLAITTGGYVRLVAPDMNLSFPVIFEDLNCTAAAWVNEE
jgi:hypothetical protein